MSIYFCPDHPKQLLYDDNPPSSLVSTNIRVPPKIVVCPVDSKAHYLEDCLREGGFEIGSPS
jgi:hypothetical protein